jgi:hypothetical protein
MYAGAARHGLGDASTGADPASDPTPIPAGAWVTVGFYQNALGGFNSFTESWTGLATNWAGYVNWPQAELLIRDTVAYSDAILQLQVTNDTTVAQVYAVLNAISPDVSVRSIWINGARASAATLAAQEAGNADTLSNLINNPVSTIANVATSSLLQLLVPVALLGGAAYLAVSQAEKTKTYRKYVLRR